jgi:sugar phosphate isomerase/epimerase
MDLGNGLGHLTYSTLVHPADTWDELWDSVRAFLPPIKQRVCPDAPFAVSLRLSAATVARLLDDAAALADLRAFLAGEGLYVITANAFPYGPFKNQLVMETVFEPDWRERRRVEYTKGVATILSSLAGDGVSPTIQTAPLGFKPHVTPGVVARFTEGMLAVVAHLVDIARATGTTVRLGLEPEPFCLLETTTEAIDYFRDELFADAAAARLAQLAGIDAADAAAALRAHLGVVFDICHQAVEFEDIGASLDALVAAAVPIVKLQVAAAMRIPVVRPEIVEQLGPFTDTVYLSQTMERRGDAPTRRFLNLRDALTCWEPGGAATEWRTHFHVPVFLDELGDLGTTRFAIAEALAKHRAQPLSDQVEIETYTWDVLPARFKSGDIVEYVERELSWVTAELTGTG